MVKSKLRRPEGIETHEWSRNTETTRNTLWFEQVA